MPAPTPAVASRAFDWRRFLNRHGWTLGVYLLLFALILYWRTVPPQWGTFDVQSLVIDALPLSFAAMAQAVVIISGGIDLSIGSLMALINVLSARYMVEGIGDLEVGTVSEPVSFRKALLVAAVLVLGFRARGRAHRPDHRRQPDRGHHRHARDAVRLGGSRADRARDPGRRSPLDYTKLGTGYTLTPWLPTGS